MDFGSLIVIVGIGATVDVLADVQTGKPPIVPLLGAGLMLIILAAIGRVTGQWGLVAAVAFLYVIASFLRHWPTVSKSGFGFVQSLTK